jgi:hypothetical protein
MWEGEYQDPSIGKEGNELCVVLNARTNICNFCATITYEVTLLIQTITHSANPSARK